MLLSATADFGSHGVGSKAVRLQELMAAGFLVPEFVVLTGEYLHALSSHTVTKDITSALPTTLYAVRSAALSEDTKQSAQAGRFLSKMSVELADLLTAVQAVVADAQSKGVAIRTEFSIIVQKYIQPDYAGVLFTRNPLGGREMVINYAAGAGEQVVSGKSGTTVTLYGGRMNQAASGEGFTTELQKQAQLIEKLYDFPQDIEWAYAANKLYLLQTRPITTLTPTQYAHVTFLSAHLPNEAFYFEQSTISESLARPSPLALSILKRLYAAGGPIASAYQALGVRYTATPQFRLVGNQLYIDKQAETKALFPALGFLKRPSTTAWIETLSGIWTTIVNTVKLNQLSVAIDQSDVKSLLQSLHSDEGEPSGVKQSLEQLEKQYEQIFQINLHAQIALARLEAAAGSKELAQKLIASTQPTLTLSLETADVPAHLVGNSISIDDTSEFYGSAVASQTVMNNHPLSFTARALLPKAVMVNNWLHLREVGRWLTVKLITEIRNSAYRLATKQGFVDQNIIHFASLSELFTTIPSEAELKARQRAHNQLDQYDFPRQLASFAVSPRQSDTAVLAPGFAVGTLCLVSDIERVKGSKILLVNQLIPELTKYFDSVAGIVCQSGGLLSHLAIMAREAGLPVVRVPAAAHFLNQEVTVDTTAAELVVGSKKG